MKLVTAALSQSELDAVYADHVGSTNDDLSDEEGCASVRRDRGLLRYRRRQSRWQSRAASAGVIKCDARPSKSTQTVSPW